MKLSNQTSDYLTVFEEVSKYNVQLNILEKLWAVRPPRTIPDPNYETDLGSSRSLGTYGWQTIPSPPAS